MELKLSSSKIILEASYMDMLNLAWPRERYTNTSSPGIAYML